ncbi:MAG TPA: hypothetical protein VGS80_13555 [Ktedonobacterales bacterium]|nr:hypothetical protein [Ktedonobacterales bacterium]
MSIVAHLAGKVFKTIFGMLFGGLFFGVVGAGAALAVAYANSPHWPLQPLAYITAVIIGGLAAYAAALTVLLRAILGGVKEVERDVVSGAERAERDLTGVKS